MRARRPPGRRRAGYASASTCSAAGWSGLVRGRSVERRPRVARASRARPRGTSRSGAVRARARPAGPRRAPGRRRGRGRDLEPALRVDRRGRAWPRRRRAERRAPRRGRAARGLEAGEPVLELREAAAVDGAEGERARRAPSRGRAAPRRCGGRWRGRGLPCASYQSAAREWSVGARPGSRRSSSARSRSRNRRWKR